VVARDRIEPPDRTADAGLFRAALPLGMGRQRKNENAEAYEYLLWRKNMLARTYARATSFSMDVNVSTKRKYWAFLRVSKFFRQKRTKPRRNGGGRGIRTPVALSG
jgi:hypothetical protein